MFRSLAIAAAVSVVAALPAAAESVTVNVAGLDAKAAHAKILRAAEQACSVVLQDGAVARYYEMPSCVSDAVSAAEAKIASANDHRFASVQNTGR